MKTTKNLLPPCGWTVARLQDLGELNRGKSKHRPRNDPRLYGGPYPFIQTGDVRASNGTISEYSQTYSELGLSQSRLWPSSTLCITIAANIADTGILKWPACFPDSVVGFIPHDNLVLVEFVENYIRFFRERLDRLAPATAQKNINLKILSDVEIPLAPLPEQHRIVEAIESYFSRLDDAVATLERVQRNLKRYRASVLKAAVEGRLVPTEAELAKSDGRDFEPASVLLERILAERRRRWEEAELAKMKAKGKTPKNDRWKKKYKEPEAPDTEGLPELPEGWCWTSLDQLTGFVSSGSRGWAQYYSNRGAIFIRAQDLKHDVLDLSDPAKVLLPGSVEGTRTRVEPYDLLVTITGANVTKTGFAPSGLGEAYVSQHVGLCRLVDPALIDFLHLWVTCTAGGRAFLEKAAYGAGKPGLNLQNLKELPVPLAPIAEITRLVEVAQALLTTAVATEHQCETSYRRCRRLRQSILKWAFEGKLADQDPSDEPAAALLDRIKAEQAAATPKKTRRGRKPSRKNA